MAPLHPSPTHPTPCPTGWDLLMKIITWGPRRFLEGLRLQACLMGRHHFQSPNKFTAQLCSLDGAKFLLLSPISL